MTGPEVHFRVADDAEASRIAALLKALGYAPIREVSDVSSEVHMRRVVDVLSRRYRLTLSEADVLERILAGQTNVEIGAALEVSRATVKWHTHNMLGKTGLNNREGLLRLALRTKARC